MQADKKGFFSWATGTGSAVVTGENARADLICTMWFRRRMEGVLFSSTGRRGWRP